MVFARGVDHCREAVEEDCRTWVEHLIGPFNANGSKDLSALEPDRMLIMQRQRSLPFKKSLSFEDVVGHIEKLTTNRS